MRECAERNAEWLYTLTAQPVPDEVSVAISMQPGALCIAARLSQIKQALAAWWLAMSLFLRAAGPARVRTSAEEQLV